MTVSDEMLAAYADGELDEFTAARVKAAIDQDAELHAKLASLQALQQMLSARFDPILAQPVPERIAAPIQAARNVVDLGAVRVERRPWTQRVNVRLAGGAIAATLALAVFLFAARQGADTPDRPDAKLAAALSNQVSGAEGPSGTTVLLSFRDKSGNLCRGYRTQRDAGIACRSGSEWQVRLQGGSGAQQASEYRQAGSGSEAIMAAAQDMAAGDPFDDVQEKAAIANGWQR